MDEMCPRPGAKTKDNRSSASEIVAGLIIDRNKSDALFFFKNKINSIVKDDSKALSFSIYLRKNTLKSRDDRGCHPLLTKLRTLPHTLSNAMGGSGENSGNDHPS